MAQITRAKGSDGASALILLTAIDSPGLAKGLFETLAPFAITITNIEQVVIDGRLILSVQICLNPAHANAIENDLLEKAESLGADIAIAFNDSPAPSSSAKGERIYVHLSGDPIKPLALAQICGILTALGANIERICLGSSPVPLIQLVVSGSTDAEIRTALSLLSRTENYEIAVLAEEFLHARKILVLDVDSTLIEQEVIELLARRAGAEEAVKEITEKAMNGELDFAQSLMARVALLKGLPEAVLEEVSADITLTPGAEMLIRSLRFLGHSVGLVTGGFVEVIAPLVAHLGITHVKANSLEVKDGLLTGRTQGPIIDRAAKARALAEFAHLESIPMTHSIAIGDGANDIDMVAAANLGIAFNAKSALKEKADTLIGRMDLALVLDLLGIPRLS